MQNHANIDLGVDCCDLGAIADPEFFAALAEPNRMNIIIRLLDATEPMSVTALSETVPVHVSVVSRHLRQLERAGLVTSERVGRTVLYRANGTLFAGVLRSLADAIDGAAVEESQA